MEKPRHSHWWKTGVACMFTPVKIGLHLCSLCIFTLLIGCSDEKDPTGNSPDHDATDERYDGPFVHDSMTIGETTFEEFQDLGKTVTDWNEPLPGVKTYYLEEAYAGEQAFIDLTFIDDVLEGVSVHYKDELTTTIAENLRRKYGVPSSEKPGISYLFTNKAGDKIYVEGGAGPRGTLSMQTGGFQKEISKRSDLEE